MAIRVKRNGEWVTIGSGGSGAVDTTLTQPGMAADAAVTGAMIEDLRKLYDESKITNINFSNWEDGSFIVSYTDSSTATFQVQFDSENRPSKIIDSTGNAVSVQW